jgi:hypothetical protein
MMIKERTRKRMVESAWTDTALAHFIRNVFRRKVFEGDLMRTISGANNEAMR